MGICARCGSDEPQETHICRRARKEMINPTWKTEYAPATQWPHNMTETQWRHELAARAMEGAVDAWARGEVDAWSQENVAHDCYQLADAMIEKGKKDDY